MPTPLFLQNFASLPPRYSRPQRESLEWLAAAHARAAVTKLQREDAYEKLQERMAHLIRRYSCADEHIGSRRSDIPDFMHTEWQRMLIFNLHENPQGRGLGARNAFYAETVNKVVESLFENDTEPPSDLLHVSCTGYVSPSAIQRLIGKKLWNGRTSATHVYHMGCYAAFPALRVASGFLSHQQRAGSRAEIVHTELCTIHFNPADHSPGQLVVQTLFADGYIRYSLAPEVISGKTGALEILALREEIIPDSLEDMTWVLSDWGFQMSLSRDVPGKIAHRLPEFLSGLFEDAGMGRSGFPRAPVYAVHPGGPRILDSIEQLLGLEKDQLQFSRRMLFERGNMSSATLPHIWSAVAADDGVGSGTFIVSLAFGPGLTIAGAVFRKC